MEVAVRIKSSLKHYIVYLYLPHSLNPGVWDLEQIDSALHRPCFPTSPTTNANTAPGKKRRKFYDNGVKRKVDREHNAATASGDAHHRASWFHEGDDAFEVKELTHEY